jgi:hypothetical protein
VCGFTCDAQHLACGGACCSVYGNATPFSGTGGYTSDQMCVRPVTIGQAGKLASIGIITSTSGAGVRLGLYADAAGAPGALVAQTTAGTLDGSAVVLTTPITSVTAGNYWIALLFDAAVDVLEDRSTTVTSYCTTATFGSLPSSFPSEASYQGGPANLYVLVQ